METKKNRKFDLEGKRATYFLIGLAIALAVVFSTFNFGVPVKATKLPDFKGATTVGVDFYIQRTTDDQSVAPPPVIMPFADIIITPDDSDIPDIPFVINSDPKSNLAIGHIELPKPTVDIYDYVAIPEVNPEFPGGAKSLQNWLSKNVVYPKEAENMSISGRVFLRFEVDEKGKISNAKVIKGIDPMLDEEALRVVNSMPKWKPGMQNGRPVKTSFSIFINFKIAEN